MTSPPTRSAPGRAFLILPGAWHCAAHYQLLINQLTMAGHLAIAIDYPGVGFAAPALADDLITPSTAAGLGIDDYRDAALPVLERLAQRAPVTVVAHSLGGLVASAVAEAAPMSVQQLAYITAYMPIPDGPAGAAEINARAENSASRSGDPIIGDPLTLGALRMDLTTGRGLELAHQAFYNDIPFADFAPYGRLLHPDLPISIAGARVEVSARRWGEIPRLFIRCTLDRAIPLALQDWMLSETDARTVQPAQVRTLVASHSPFASQPEALAKLLTS